jgi:glycosyltransferase 2 family protein
MAASQSDTTNPFSPRPWLRAILRIGGSLVALLVLFHFLPIAQIAHTLGRLPPQLWLLIVAGYLGAHLIAINKWRMMVNLAGASLTFRQAVRCYFSGLFSTLFLPSIVGGDVVRGALALRSGQSRTSIFLGGLIDRILDFAALALITALGAILVPGELPPEARRVFVTLSIILIVLLVLSAPVILWFPARKLSFALRRRIVRLRRAAHSMRCQPHRVGAAFSLGLLAQGSFIWLTARLADSSGLHLLFRAWLFAWPLAKLSAVIPITQGGIGVREAALIFLLVPFGAPAVKTAAVGLAWEAVIYSGGLIAGLTAVLLRPQALRTTTAMRPEASAEGNSVPSKPSFP